MCVDCRKWSGRMAGVMRCPAASTDATIPEMAAALDEKMSQAVTALKVRLREWPVCQVTGRPLQIWCKWRPDGHAADLLWACPSCEETLHV